jgi:hypothetical protein
MVSSVYLVNITVDRKPRNGRQFPNGSARDMTRALPFTEHGLRRAIKAVHKSGLHVAGVRPDGTVLVHDGDNPLAPVAAAPHDAEALRRWGDTQA